MKSLIYIFSALLLLNSCVSSKKFKELTALNDKNYQDFKDVEEKLNKTDGKAKDCSDSLSDLETKISLLKADYAKLNVSKEQLEKDIEAYRKLNDELTSSKKDLLNQANDNQSYLSNALANKEKELNAISAAQKELDIKLKKRELELNAMQAKNESQNQRILDLESKLAEKDTALQLLKTNITNALKGFNSDEIQVEEKDGKLHVSLSENLLFTPGSFTVDSKGEDAITKLGEVLAKQTEFDIVVEGHTDNDPFKGNGQLLDNWDLSTKRATSVVRILTEKANVAPSKVSASGRGEHIPLTTNDSKEAKAKNRRTEIILSPKLDKIFNLLNQN